MPPLAASRRAPWLLMTSLDKVNHDSCNGPVASNNCHVGNRHGPESNTRRLCLTKVACKRAGLQQERELVTGGAAAPVLFLCASLANEFCVSSCVPIYTPWPVSHFPGSSEGSQAGRQHNTMQLRPEPTAWASQQPQPTRPVPEPLVAMTERATRFVLGHVHVNTESCAQCAAPCCVMSALRTCTQRDNCLSTDTVSASARCISSAELGLAMAWRDRTRSHRNSRPSVRNRVLQAMVPHSHSHGTSLSHGDASARFGRGSICSLPGCKVQSE
ncbi:hypothetical protein EDB80DRAFT_675369 [Ilyonectria destructans]|nr:hypothetical protein EDB80DRAFT_675369 [Ilyonectria destructans]